MTSHDDTDPIEHDPTGMRALLRSLPDPEPMPADLVARIDAALTAEARASGRTRGSLPAHGEDSADRAPGAVVAPEDAAHGASWPAPARPDGAPADESVPDDVVVPLRRRGAWRGALVAAGVLGVLGLGGLVVDSVSPSGLQATLGIGEGSSGGSDSAAGGVDPGLSPESGKDLRRVDGGFVLVAADQTALVRVVSGRSFDSGQLPTMAASLVAPPYAAFAAAQADGASADAPGDRGAVSTAAGARACADALGVPDADEVVVELAVIDDAPAAALIATDPSGQRLAWVVGRDCAPGSPDVLSGPVSAP